MIITQDHVTEINQWISEYFPDIKKENFYEKYKLWKFNEDLKILATTSIQFNQNSGNYSPSLILASGVIPW